MTNQPNPPGAEHMTTRERVSAPRHRANTLPTPIPASHVVGMYPLPSVLPVSTETAHYSFGAGAL